MYYFPKPILLERKERHREFWDVHVAVAVGFGWGGAIVLAFPSVPVFAGATAGILRLFVDGIGLGLGFLAIMVCVDCLSAGRVVVSGRCKYSNRPGGGNSRAIKVVCVPRFLLSSEFTNNKIV